MKKCRMLNIGESKAMATIRGVVPFVAKDIKAKEKTDIAYKIGFARAIGTDQDQITWPDLEKLLKKKNLAICDMSGFMKVVNADDNED